MTLDPDQPPLPRGGVEPRGRAEIFVFSDAPPQPPKLIAESLADSGLQRFSKYEQVEHFQFYDVQGVKEPDFSASQSRRGLQRGGWFAALYIARKGGQREFFTDCASASCGTEAQFEWEALCENLDFSDHRSFSLLVRFLRSFLLDATGQVGCKKFGASYSYWRSISIIMLQRRKCDSLA